MSEANRGASPDSANAVSTPAAPIASPASSLPQSQDNFLSEVQKANTPGALRGLMASLPKRAPVAAKPAAVVEPPAAGTTPAAEPETPAETPEEATPTAEEPAGTPAEEAAPQEPEVDTEVDDETEDDGSPVTPISSKKQRLQLREDDKVGRLATSYLKRNRDWSMEQALEAARNQLGIKPVVEDVKPDANAKPKPGSDLPQTVDAVDMAVENLWAEKEKAIQELRFEDSVKIDRQLAKLDKHRLNLEREGERKQAEQAAAYDRTFTASEAKAAELYEFASKPDSTGGKRMMEIEAALRETNDPLFFSPDKPLRIAQMVANELSIAPKRKGAPAAVAKPATAPVATAPKKQVIPGGGSRTTPTSAPNGNAAEISSIKSPAELRALQKRLGLPY